MRATSKHTLTATSTIDALRASHLSSIQSTMARHRLKFQSVHSWGQQSARGGMAIGISVEAGPKVETYCHSEYASQFKFELLDIDVLGGFSGFLHDLVAGHRTVVVLSDG
eukprot:5192727-Amphidinium_carterae.1